MAVAKKRKTGRGRKQDRARVAGGQDDELQYEAKDRKVGTSGEKGCQKGRQRAQARGETAWPLTRRVRCRGSAPVLSQGGILGRYHRSSSAPRELRPPLRQGRCLLAGLDGRYRRPAPAHADPRVPASNRAPRTRGWRQLPEARRLPIRASCGSSVADPSSSASRSLLPRTNPCPVNSFRHKAGIPKCPGRRLFHAFRRYRSHIQLQNARAA